MPFQDQDQTGERTEKRVCLGKIIKPHGVKGLVKILIHADDPRLLEIAKPVYTSENGSESLQIALKNSDGKFWLAALEGIQDRTEAEKWGNTELFVDRKWLPEIEEDGQFYFEDLKNLKVIENKEEIGTIIEANNFGASDLLEIRPKSGKSYYLPFTDEYVLEVNLEKGEVIVQNSELMRLE